jgi:hypothetical protein
MIMFHFLRICNQICKCCYEKIKKIPIKTGFQKKLTFTLTPNSLIGVLKNGVKKAVGKNAKKSAKPKNLLFFRETFHFNEIRKHNEHKILRFQYSILIFIGKKRFLVRLSLFICLKNGPFPDILQKVKTYSFANSNHSPFESH